VLRGLDFTGLLNGGASRDRTDGLVVANDALSQLSYSPTQVGLLLSELILPAFSYMHQEPAPIPCPLVALQAVTWVKAN
jgi:hypothetical protein